MKADEIASCKNSPYYFATTYLTIKTRNGEIKPFTTLLSEEEFNNHIKSFMMEYNPIKIRKIILLK